MHISFLHCHHQSVSPANKRGPPKLQRPEGQLDPPQVVGPPGDVPADNGAGDQADMKQENQAEAPKHVPIAVSFCPVV